MVRGKSAAEDDLYALAAQAGKEGSTDTQAGILFLGDVQGTEPGGINQKGDDPGFETRVKPPSGRANSSKASSATRGTSGNAEKKTASRPRGSASERTTQEIAEAVERKFNEFFAVISIGMPVTGVYGVENSGKAVNALMSIGKRRPAVMKALMRLADGADGIDIGQYVLGIMTAVQVDMKRIPYDNMLSKATGVTEIVEKYFLDEAEAPNPNVTEQKTYARFQAVS